MKLQDKRTLIQILDWLKIEFVHYKNKKDSYEIAYLDEADTIQFDVISHHEIEDLISAKRVRKPSC